MSCNVESTELSSWRVDVLPHATLVFDHMQNTRDRTADFWGLGVLSLTKKAETISTSLVKMEFDTACNVLQ